MSKIDLVSFFKDNSKYIFVLAIILVVWFFGKRIFDWIQGLFVGKNKLPEVTVVDQNLLISGSLTSATAVIYADRLERAMSKMFPNKDDVENVVDSLVSSPGNVRLLVQAFGKRRSLTTGPIILKDLRGWITLKFGRSEKERNSDLYRKWDLFLRTGGF